MTGINVEATLQEKGLTAPRVTPEHIKTMHSRVSYVFDTFGTSTFCHAFLDTAFYLATGHSACVSPKNFDQYVGENIAQRNAEHQVNQKLWQFEGYRLYAQLNGEEPFHAGV
jgi:hypothetical protein